MFFNRNQPLGRHVKVSDKKQNLKQEKADKKLINMTTLIRTITTCLHVFDRNRTRRGISEFPIHD